jgi:NAD(P)-dependent dehydrogenase (short-subunit alcohol dehydrogenase family)
MSRLAGKVAIVTGSGAGIGQGIALMFAAQGAKVMGCDIRGEKAAETADQSRAAGFVAESYAADLTTEAGAQGLIEATMVQFGRIDILVNAGAFGAFKMIDDMSFSDWRMTMAGELDIVFLVTKAAWRHLKQSGRAAIVNFASANAHHALHGSGALAHCAGKGGVLAMTRQLAMEGGPFNIRANCVSPGMTVTDATRDLLENEEFKEHVLSKNMIKILGYPEDIAYAALYLASDESKYVTATDISIDAGATAW